MRSLICFLIWSILSFFSPAPWDWDYRFLPKTVLHEWSEDSDCAPPKLHGKAGASDSILSKCIQWCNLPPTQFWDNPSHSWPTTLPPKTQQGIRLQVEDFPALGILARQKQNMPLVGKKMDLSRRQVVTVHLTGIWEKKGVYKEGRQLRQKQEDSHCPLQKSQTLLMLFWKEDLHTAKNLGRFQFTVGVRTALLLGKRAHLP